MGGHEIRLRLGEGGSELRFTDDVVTIGRGDDNMVVLPDARISSVHGQLIWRDSSYVYQDLGSTNGSMVRKKEGRNLVVSPSKGPVQLETGDRLLLGDVERPVRIDILAIDEVESSALGIATESVSMRSVKDMGMVGTALVNNPLTSRKVLRDLFELFREVSTDRERKIVVGKLLGFALETLRSATLAGLYGVRGGKLEQEAFRVRDGSTPKVPSGNVLRDLFRASFDEEVSIMVEDNTALKKAFGSPLVGALASPILRDGSVDGILFVGGPQHFTQFDLDLLTVLTHQGGAALSNIDLIDQLSAAEAKLRTENTYLKEVLKRDEVSVQIIGESAALKRTLKQVEVVARTDTTVLLLGETGTGKELFARYLHEAGQRRDALFAAVNCGALAETLLESELFGHKRGAFTGAHADRKGLFQVADGGTLFLDEVGDVSPALQVKLLRALETGEIFPVGAMRPEQVDVRIVAATNKDLRKEVAEGRFREDLYYRINVFPVNLPPLRERTGDVPILAEFFLVRFNDSLGKRVIGISPEGLEQLRAYNWPGNIRELQNEIERAVLLTDDEDEIQPEALSERISGMLELPVKIGPLKETMARLEEQYIVRALKEHDNNRTQTAKTLGISRQALTVKLSKYGIIGS